MPQEIEAKFYLHDKVGFLKRVKAAGAELIQPRVYETNLRFDLPDQSLSSRHQVLRLRKDQAAHLTFKGPSIPNHPVSSRDEIEIEVSDFKAAWELLANLGYIVIVEYQKYRTTYRYRDLLVTLDEMPYGNFSEIEGLWPEEIRQAAISLGLKWEARSSDSYLAIFNRLKSNTGVEVEDLTFTNFSGWPVTPAELGLVVAD